jgi:hypothetical protein
MRQSGAIGLALVAIIALTLVMIAGMLMMNSVKSKQAVATSSTASMLTMQQAALDFGRQNKRLPTVAEFNALTQATTNSIGRKAIYLVDDRFSTVGTNICTLPFDGLLRVNDCGSDTTCVNPGVIQGLVFVLLDSGQNVLSLADPVHQSSTRTVSTNITPATANQNPNEIVRRYAAGVSVGRFANVSIDQTIYDDGIEFASAASLREAAGCNLVSQGDVIVSGGDLRILNTSPPPDATLGNAYSKIITAYGMDAATYSFSVTLGALPPGLSLSPPTGKTVTITGTPTVAGTYSFTLAVTATTVGGYSRTASIPVVMKVTACPNWVNSGAPQTTSCPPGETGSVTRQLQTDACTPSVGTQWVNISNTCVCTPTWSDTGATRSVSCPVGQTGSALEKEQLQSCTNNRQWVPVSNTCVNSAPVFSTCQCLRLIANNVLNLTASDPQCTNACCSAFWLGQSPRPCSGPFCTFNATCPFP